MTASATAEARPFRVLVTSAGFEPGFRGGGPIRSLAGIVDTVTDQTKLFLVTRDRDLGATDAYPGLSGRWVDRGGSRIFYLNTRRPRQWFELWHQLRKVKFDLLYVNSLWDPTFTALPVVALRLGLIHADRLLLAPRGELAPGALSLKGRKKRIFLRSWTSFLKTMHAVWHASSDNEASYIRTLNPAAHVEVTQNPVSLPLEPLAPDVGGPGLARLVFIGRISQVKNLRSVLAALEGVSNPVTFDIYGPVEDASYWAKCQQVMAGLPGHIRVSYKGELAAEEVRATFSKYDAFVFPTLGESFGHIIAESLSASCPVICSDMTPWTEILKGGGGVALHDPSIRALTTQLDQLAAMTSSDRLRMRELAGDAYRVWRAGASSQNILEQARLAAWPAGR